MFKIITELYYFVGLYFLYFEAKNFFQPHSHIVKGILHNIYKEDVKNEFARTVFVKSILPDIFYALWCVVGMFTVNWLAFFLLFLLSFVTRKLHDKVKGQELVNVIKIDAVLSFIVLLMIFKSHYFHTWQLL